jgi:SAM-dependent methyltransferase
MADAAAGASGLEFEPVKRCVLCDGAEQHDARGVSWHGVPFSYVYCGRCGLKYMTPRPTEKSYARFYEEAFWQQKLSAVGYATNAGFDHADRDQLALRMPKYEGRYRRIAAHLGRAMRLDGNISILEVGCAFGFSLEWLRRDFSCRVFGIEPSERARRRCEAAKISLVGTTAEAVFHGVGAPEASYDAVIFAHSLENIVAPIGVLEGVGRALKPGGAVLVYTPNLEYRDSMNPYHPYIYTPETLARLLARAGLFAARIEAPPAPTTRAAAVALVKPSDEIVCIARRAESADDGSNAPRVDVRALADRHALGQKARIWADLSTRELVKRTALQVASDVRRKLGR